MKTLWNQKSSVRAARQIRPAKSLTRLCQFALCVGYALLAGAPASAQSPWPFDQPSISTLRGSSKKVFAHYMVDFPVSIDNKDWKQDYYTTQYQSPSGEGGVRISRGGLAHERPLTRGVRTETNWQSLDFQDEVKTAAKLGIDGFTLLINQYRPPGDNSSKNWNSVKLMLNAAQSADSGFKIVLMPDMTAGFQNSATDDTSLTNAVLELSAYPAAYRIGSKLVVSPYAADHCSASWWQTWLAKMKTKGVDIYFVPVISNWKVNASAFTFADGMSTWGDRSPGANTSDANDAQAMHALKPAGWTVMLPVSPQDYRVKSSNFQEAQNSLNYRTMWDNAIKTGGTATQKADWVQICTWNDYSEASEIAPSTGIQYTFYDLTAYYTAWFKNQNQAQPAITRDVLYYFHRSQSINATYDTTVQTVPTVRAAGSDAPVDQIELLSFLTQPATLKIQFGGQTSKPATGYSATTSGSGITSLFAPFTSSQTGKPKFSYERNGAAVQTWSSDFEITNPVIYQDRLYRGNSTTRVATRLTYATINFQPPTAAVPNGYRADTGNAYALLGDGSLYEFGWLLNGVPSPSNNAVERNNVASPDKRYDTFNQMQYNSTTGVTWEIKVPNGVWKVHAVCGDPAFFDGIYKLNAEGTRIITGSQDSVNLIRWLEGTKTVNVTDGKLTLTCSNGSRLTKLCYLDISQW